MEVIKYLEFAFFIFIVYKILKEEEQEDAFYWFVFGCILLYPRTYVISGLPLPTVILPCVCIVRTWLDGRLKEEWNIYPFRSLMIIMFIYHIVHPFLSSWLPIKECIKEEFFDYFRTFSVMLGGYLLAPQEYDREKMKRNILIISSVLIITGTLCWVLNSNFIAASFSSTGDSYFGSDRVDTARGFRATGTQFSPNSYGNALVLCILLVNHYYKEKFIKYTTISFLLLCIVFTSSRTPFIILVLGVSIYYLFQQKSRLFSIVIFFYFLFAALGNQLMNNEYVGKYVGGITDLVLTGGENTEGSSSDLRKRQWLVTLFYLNEAPWFGHGEGYTMQLVNEDGCFYNRKIDDIAGAEGYQYITLIDHGVCYTLLAFLFFYSIFSYFVRIIKTGLNRESAMFGICLSSCLFIFLLSSRPNQIWQIYFPFIGLYLKNIVYTVSRNEYYTSY